MKSLQASPISLFVNYPTMLNIEIQVKWSACQRPTTLTLSATQKPHLRTDPSDPISQEPVWRNKYISILPTGDRVVACLTIVGHWYLSPIDPPPTPKKWQIGNFGAHGNLHFTDLLQSSVVRHWIKTSFHLAWFRLQTHGDIITAGGFEPLPSDSGNQNLVPALKLGGSRHSHVPPARLRQTYQKLDGYPLFRWDSREFIRNNESHRGLDAWFLLQTHGDKDVCHLRPDNCSNLGKILVRGVLSRALKASVSKNLWNRTTGNWRLPATPKKFWFLP